MLKKRVVRTEFDIYVFIEGIKGLIKSRKYKVENTMTIKKDKGPSNDKRMSHTNLTNGLTYRVLRKGKQFLQH